MSIQIRDGKMDVLLLQGPRVSHWPSVGVHRIAEILLPLDLKVGWVGGESLQVRGVIPQAGVGALVFAQDAQKRIHRWFARSVVRFSAEDEFPDPFAGWTSANLIPLSTAVRLKEYGSFLRPEQLVILGTGNSAFCFAVQMIQSGCPSVILVETTMAWGGKRFAGWEVERRHFERLGGKVLEGDVLRVTRTSPSRVEVDLTVGNALLTLPADWVVSAGPFSKQKGWREYPPGSSLFELTQTSHSIREEHISGWILEEERARGIGVRIARDLLPDLADARERIEKEYKRSKRRLRLAELHYERSFSPMYQGKWLVSADAARIRDFPGTRKSENASKKIALIECIEPIGCRICQETCPENAILIQRSKDQFLDPEVCTACGVCLKTCPSQIPILSQMIAGRSMGEITLPYTGMKKWVAGELISLLNRRGEHLGGGRILEQQDSTELVSLVRVEVPVHLMNDARSIRSIQNDITDSQDFYKTVQNTELGERVEVLINNDKRRVREGLPITAALFENRLARSQDRLFCKDGSCGMCSIMVDGVKKQACQTRVRSGMSIRFTPREENLFDYVEICPCKGIPCRTNVEVASFNGGDYQSPEARMEAAQIAQGKCHGQICGGVFRRMENIPDEWIDWSFPWSDWTFGS